MQKSALLTAAVIVVGVVVYSLTRPEPTPAERLSEAAQEVGDATRDAAEELAAVAEETVEAVQDQTEAKVDEMQNDAAEVVDAISKELTTASADARTQLETLVQEWRDTGIVSDEGIDFDAAIAAVNATELDSETKLQVNGLLESMRDLPGDAKMKLEALENSL